MSSRKRLEHAVPTGLDWLECPMCGRVNGRGRVTDFYHIAAKATATTTYAVLMVLKYFSMRPTAAAAPKRPTAQRQYSHHISRTTHHSGTDCRCYDIQHFTPVRRTSYRAAPLSSWRQKRSGFSSVT